VTIENRLKEERERLGFTQPDFAGLAGTTKKTVIDYEKGKTSPKASFLEAIARVGADVSYIITGIKSVIAEKQAGYAFTPDKADLLDYFEHCSEEDKRTIRRMAELCAKESEADSQAERASERASEKSIYVRGLYDKKTKVSRNSTFSAVT
jgi:transcriptional regulator with XRE-family HTH domain